MKQFIQELEKKFPNEKGKIGISIGKSYPSINLNYSKLYHKSDIRSYLWEQGYKGREQMRVYETVRKQDDTLRKWTYTMKEIADKFGWTYQGINQPFYGASPIKQIYDNLTCQKEYLNEYYQVGPRIKEGGEPMSKYMELKNLEEHVKNREKEIADGKINYDSAMEELNVNLIEAKIELKQFGLDNPELMDEIENLEKKVKPKSKKTEK